MQRGSRCRSVVRAGGSLADRDLPREWPSRKGRLQLFSATGEKASNVRQTNRSLTCARPRERRAFYHLEFVEAVLPNKLQILHRHLRAGAHSASLRALRNV